MPTGRSGDVDAIKNIIGRQFASMSWKEGEGPDLDAFRDDFHSAARLFASARPSAAQSVAEFEIRMQSIAESSLRSFEERVLGVDVTVHGNVAVAAVACEATENGREVNRNVEMMLLVKDAGRWRIVAQAWDKEDDDTPLPDALLKGV